MNYTVINEFWVSEERYVPGMQVNAPSDITEELASYLSIRGVISSKVVADASLSSTPEYESTDAAEDDATLSVGDFFYVHEDRTLRRKLGYR